MCQAACLASALLRRVFRVLPAAVQLRQGQVGRELAAPNQIASPLS
jgi:hypothetical protein